MYDYGYGYGYSDYSTTSSLLGGMAAMLGVISILSLAMGILMIISLWKIFKKAGKNGWEAIIPIYNFIVLIEITGLPMWYIALFFIPFANIYAMFKIYIELAHKFGKSTGFGVLTVFFSMICLPIFAFGKNNVYNGNNNNLTNMNNNVQPQQFNQNNAFGFQNVNNNMENNNNFNNPQPVMFNQNVNEPNNPVTTQQGQENNNMNNAFNNINSMQPQNNFGNPVQNTNLQSVSTPVVPTQNEVTPEVNTFKYEEPIQPVNVEPTTPVIQNPETQNVEQNNIQQPMNANPGMNFEQPTYVQNPNNNNNTNM